jgi:hypothetical protein
MLKTNNMNHIPIHPAYTNLYNISMERFSKLEDRLTKK